MLKAGGTCGGLSLRPQRRPRRKLGGGGLDRRGRTGGFEEGGLDDFENLIGGIALVNEIVELESAGGAFFYTFVGYGGAGVSPGALLG